MARKPVKKQQKEEDDDDLLVVVCRNAEETAYVESETCPCFKCGRKLWLSKSSKADMVVKKEKWTTACFTCAGITDTIINPVHTGKHSMEQILAYFNRTN